MDFICVDYLSKGNLKQKSAFNALKELRILEVLKDFQPVVVGTIPIEIDINQSDIDIICKASNLESFEKLIALEFGEKDAFQQRKTVAQGILCSVSSFDFRNFEFEIFAQNIETTKQNAYRHMLVENRILKLANPRFKREVIKLKEIGMKTEEAFASLLDLSGDPYSELLKLESESDESLSRLLNSFSN